MNIDWGRSSAEILRLARACDFYPFPSPWGLPRAIYAGRALDVLRLELCSTSKPTADPGSILSLEDGAAIVATGDGTVRLQSFLVEGVVREAADILQPHTRLGTPA
jgi:methionyl-tRNA formyltransferase